MNTKKHHFSENIDFITLLGIRIHLLTIVRLHEYMVDVIQQDRRALILNVNVHCFNIIHQNSWIREVFERSDITFCDGAGVMLGARLMGGKHIPERITYADWMWQLAEVAQRNDLSFFFLGGKAGVAEKAAQKLKDRHPALKIITHHGYFDKSVNSAENRAVIDEINRIAPDILVLGFGMPLQERWLSENWDQLNANIGLTGGAVFDYISGRLDRGPQWMTDNGFEWLARLFIEPKRLWRRYIVGNPLFLYRVLKERYKKHRIDSPVQ